MKAIKKNLMIALFIVCAVALILSICRVTIAHADELPDLSSSSLSDTETSVIDEITPSDTTDETNSKLDELLKKLDESDAGVYFKTYIMPIITGAGSALVAGLVALIPYIKNRNRRKQLEAFAATLQKSNEDLEKLINSTNVLELKSALTEIFCETNKELINVLFERLENYLKSFAEIKSDIDILNAKVDCLIKGASNAWSKSTAAMSALTEVPEKSVLTKIESENEALKRYIREVQADEGEKKIKEIVDKA
nr:MAG TPA: hypothetical protein [Caudoviricetes sp.]